jgi:hypothetical protein
MSDCDVDGVLVFHIGFGDIVLGDIRHFHIERRVVGVYEGCQSAWHICDTQHQI